VSFLLMFIAYYIRVHFQESPIRGDQGQGGNDQESVEGGLPPLSIFSRPTPLLPCRIPATNCETLAGFSPQTAKPESLRRNTPETGVR
jgi:hypothetical protein